MELKEQLKAIVNENLTSEKHFLVDIIISSKSGPKKVLVLLDGDEGITIDDCAKLSRTLGFHIEEQELIEDAYRLEVSSPGLDHPLTLVRQYIKNIGRTVKVTLKDGRQVAGELKEADDSKIVIAEEKKEGKKKTVEDITLLLESINKTEIQIKF